jgi:hypothetical protein
LPCFAWQDVWPSDSVSVGDTQEDGQRIAFSYRIREGDHAMLLTYGLDTDGKFSLFADASDQEYQNMMVHTNEH